MNFAPPPVIRLNDLISGTVVTMDEWIKNEIYRLQHNIKPRHFENYSELAEMLHEDPGRFQHHYHHHLPPPCLPEEFVHSGSDSDDEEEGVDSMEQDLDQDDDDEEEEQDEQDDDNAIYQTHQQNTQLNPLKRPAAAPSPPFWLCRVFIELMRYCDRTTIQDNAPKLLLYEFEQLRNNLSLGKTIDIDEFRDSLSKILFGKIQMTEHLVQVWKLMCQWVTKPPLHTHQNATRWLDLTICAFIAAERLFIVGNEK
ncbi:hypothetical protein MUCCIDRAFT_154785 [Mucor lusitanicus CBS 277.49]|uniref:Uncharacterized protein n=1 Tax=Mucor lusitanicus CBS 277.49 TaxID=747725 RepID=A0A168PLP8_MUCCL|nr:hypothetical protein MUCCIDRAFT_154785 [Mucor lusitanicus CBS 277.49]